MFIPVSITVGAGGQSRPGYNRIIDTSARFDALAGHVRDMRVPLGRIGTDLHAQIAAAFATEGSSTATGPWTVLSPAYGDWKSQHAPGVPTLIGLRPVHKGTRDSPTRPQSYVPSGLMRLELLSPTAMHVGMQRLLYAPTSDIAGYHETGTPNMPARPPVDVSLTFLHSIDRTFAVWVGELLDQAGLAGPGSG